MFCLISMIVLECFTSKILLKFGPGHTLQYITWVLFVMFLQGFCSASTVSLPESLLFVSTLDGNLHAVSKKSGSIKWTLKEGKMGGPESCVTHFCICVNLPNLGYINKKGLFILLWNSVKCFSLLLFVSLCHVRKVSSNRITILKDLPKRGLHHVKHPISNENCSTLFCYYLSWSVDFI